MARETVEIPVASVRLYEFVAAFLCVLAHPNDKARREQFRNAWCRQAIVNEAKWNADFAWSPQRIRPGYFLMSDVAAEEASREGAKRLAERKEAYVATWPLWEAAEARKAIQEITAFGTELKNSAEGRAIMTRCWLDENSEASKDLDGKALSGNLTTRVLKKSRPVIHAAAAYWRIARLGASEEDVHNSRTNHRARRCVTDFAVVDGFECHNAEGSIIS